MLILSAALSSCATSPETCDDVRAPTLSFRPDVDGDLTSFREGDDIPSLSLTHLSPDREEQAAFFRATLCAMSAGEWESGALPTVSDLSQAKLSHGAIRVEADSAWVLSFEPPVGAQPACFEILREFEGQEEQQLTTEALVVALRQHGVLSQQHQFAHYEGVPAGQALAVVHGVSVPDAHILLYRSPNHTRLTLCDYSISDGVLEPSLVDAESGRSRFADGSSQKLQQEIHDVSFERGVYRAADATELLSVPLRLGGYVILSQSRQKVRLGVPVSRPLDTTVIFNASK